MGLSSIRTLLVALAAISVAAESPFDTYKETKRLPATCPEGYTAGSDTALFTVPYTYSKVLSVIGDFKNLTWSGVEDVTLNGTDNTVGTARSYKLFGADLTETLSLYMKPSKGPFAEVSTLAPVTVSQLNLSFYAPYNALFANPTCNGSATLINSTTQFCATNVTGTATALHADHLLNSAGISKALGGANFSTCAVLSNSTSNSTSTNTTSTRSATSSTAAPTSTSLAPSITTPAATTSPTATGKASTLAGSVVFAGLMALGAIFL